MAPFSNITVINPFPIVLPLRSTWADIPVDLNAPLIGGAWDGAGKMKFPKGEILAKNDAKFLYYALDITADTGNDPGTSDYFWLSFDINRDRSITANTDINLGLYPNQVDKIGKQLYLGPSRWTGLMATATEVKSEFGPSEASGKLHRIWKFKIPLSEINVNLAWPLGTPHTFFGFRVRSQSPAFVLDFPENFHQNFTHLRQLVLSRKPTIPTADLGPVIGSVGLIPCTKIGLNGRATTDPGYYIKVENAAFGGTLNLIGNRATLLNLWGKNARKYRVEISPPGTSSFSNLISSWNNYRWQSGNYVLHHYSPTASGLYTLVNPSHEFSINDLLVQFPTGNLPNGLHRIKVTFYLNDGVTKVSTPAQELRLFIDNHLPTAIIESIQYGGSEVSACALQKLGAAPDGIRFRITANDPEGNLLGVNLRATYGENQSINIFNEGYTIAKGTWAGFINRLLPGNWRPPVTCAYSFILTATARTTNGYTDYIGRNTHHRNLTLLLG